MEIPTLFVPLKDFNGPVFGRSIDGFVGVTKLVAWTKSVFVWYLKIWENRSIMASLVYPLSCDFFASFYSVFCQLFLKTQPDAAKEAAWCRSRQLCTSLLGSSTRSVDWISPAPERSRRFPKHMIIIMNHLYIGVSYNGGTPKWMIYKIYTLWL